MTDPQGNSITFTYDAYHRLSAVTDASGGISKLSYQGNDPTVPATYYLVQSITSPYGATASFTYDSTYELTSITDPVGITSQFTYATSPGTNGDYIGTLTTPYGNTNFLLKQIGDGYSDFALIVTDPIGATREIEYTAWTDGSTLSITYDPLGLRNEEVLKNSSGTVIAGNKLLWQGGKILRELEISTSASRVIG
jgi:YD repeat-containing protein